MRTLGWAAAIKKAEEELAKAREQEKRLRIHISRLRGALRAFRDSQQAGDTFPGAKAKR